MENGDLTVEKVLRKSVISAEEMFFFSFSLCEHRTKEKAFTLSLICGLPGLSLEKMNYTCRVLAHGTYCVVVESR